MKHIFFGFYFLFTSCMYMPYQVDDVINEHTKLSAEFSDRGNTIEFLLEQKLPDILSPQDYLFAVAYVQANLINSDAYQHITIFIAKQDTLKEIKNFNYEKLGSFTPDTNIAEYLIFINQKTFDMECEIVLDVFLHELTHAALEINDGDYDCFHTLNIWEQQKEITKEITKKLCY